MKFPLAFLAIPFVFIIQQGAFAQISNPYSVPMKLRAPIRTWAGDGVCLCPYDQVVTEGISLAFTDEDKTYTCGKTSAYIRTGGREPACYVEDRNPYGREQARQVEEQCRSLGSQACYIDFMNRF
ncbi:MAG: hypothetical protein HEQ27_12060 [Dolichospermum sp. JUN01]|jgi:hypothetical protein|uniref:hypothetical protein n=1 Tax=Anabaena sp. PCC 7108 TaxID=163908 RepID=UPI0003701DCF|nr:hypothetical protein [Anabaena sp. PCC 7108]MBO1057208.1 hypothetical protein [Dolichospermum sp. JUN01]MBS9394005.1 hypothetical protein [Dolichospermum sp. OL01]MCO5797638.1 hypothetical protein [Dolichospermum sp. OL03]MCS6280374.1 hypothetical protein [Dolichospermum sp.]QSV59150.1 MAG: hypothetical protein HEQ29_12935 [Dolichospermum sp. LBC05a]